MHAFQRFAAALILGAVVLGPVRARADEDAQTAQAHKLYSDAKKALTDKHYKEAALGFEAASRLKPHAVALYTAAQAWELAGSPARAADAYTLALRTPKLSDSQIERCKTRLAELEKTLGVLSVKGESSTHVQLDDHMDLEVPTKLYGTAGDHTLRIERADGTNETRKVALEAGKVIEYDTVESPEPQPTAPTPGAKPKRAHFAEVEKHPVDDSKPHHEGPWKTVGYFSLGAGLGVLGGGVLLALSAKDAEKAYDATPTPETHDHAKNIETKTNIALIAGGVLSVAGIGILISQIGKHEKSEGAALDLRIGPRGVSAEGRF